MTDQDAMKLALFSLDIVKIHYTQSRHINEAITALKERLALQALHDENKRLGLYKDAYAEQEQEPVVFEEWFAKQHGDPEEIGFLQALRIAYIAGQDSITTPPQRTWSGLTNQEQLDIFAQSVAKKRSEYEHYKAIEQALKEKNT